MISSQFSDKLNFWVTSASEIVQIIDAMNIYMGALYDLGYTSETVSVGGGVHELDTGYACFYSTYNSFEEMKEHLCADFVSEADSLDGVWMDTLNVGYILVALKKKGKTYHMTYSEGVITLDCGADELEVEERCRDAIAPYLWKPKG